MFYLLNKIRLVSHTLQMPRGQDINLLNTSKVSGQREPGFKFDSYHSTTQYVGFSSECPSFPFTAI